LSRSPDPKDNPLDEPQTRGLVPTHSIDTPSLGTPSLFRPTVRLSRFLVSAVLGIVLAVHMAAMAVASGNLSVRGALHTASFGTLRVVARKAGQAWDVTSEGLRVGVAPDGEERVAFCRPAFTENSTLYRNYEVVSAAVLSNPLGASYYVPTTSWDANTPPSLLFAQVDQSPASATTTYTMNVFSALIRNGNNPTGSLGFLLRSNRNLRTCPCSDVTFLVGLHIPFVVRISTFEPVCPDPATVPVPPGQQAIPDFVMSWSSTRSGVANVDVNGRELFSLPVRITGQRITQTTIPKTILVRGGNGINVVVTEDEPSVDQAPVTTSVTLTIPDVICPWNGQRSSSILRVPR